MKRFLLCFFAVTLFFSTVPAGATELEREMKAINRNVRALAKQLPDPAQKEAALKSLKELTDAAERSKALTPAKTQDLPEGERKQFVADYQISMGKLVIEFNRIAEALKAGNPKEAERIYSGLRQVKREGHEKFSSEH